MEPKVKNTMLGLRIYNACLSVLYACVFVFIPIMFATDPEIGEEGIIFGFAYSLICIGPLFLIFIIGTFTVPNRSKLNWIFQLVLVVIGFTSVLTMAPAILLLLGLISDEVRDYYYRDAEKQINSII